MKLEIRQAQASDLPQIKRLTDDYISQDFYSAEALERMLSGEDDLLFVAVDTQRDGLVVSYFYAFLAPLDEALRILHVEDRPEALRAYPGTLRVGVYKTSVTDPAYRKQGVFSAFMSDLRPVLRSRGAEMIINTSLRPLGRDVPIRNILRDTGFVPLQTLHSPWAETKGYCPYCKKNYCICDAVLYMNDFTEKEVGELDG